MENFIPQKDLYYLNICRSISLASKDPSTKVGALIVDKDGRFVGAGYNGFPKGVKDLPERYNNRETKYKFVEHAEKNAIYFSTKQDLSQCTMYSYPLSPCNECAKAIIQSGIKTVISALDMSRSNQEIFEIAKQMFLEANVNCPVYPLHQVKKEFDNVFGMM